MPRDRRAYLWDVLEAIRLIEQFTSSKTLDDYNADPMLRSAVERQLEIIGEALGQGSKHFPEIVNRITNCEQIVAFRNRLIHGYSLVSHSTVWGVVTSELSLLKSEAEILISE